MPPPESGMRPQASAVAGSASAEHTLDRLRGRLMRQSLSHLLDQAPGVRQALPHLAALEAALEEHGPSVLGGMSRPVLVKLCSQLSGLPLPNDDPPLHDLLERLMRALEASSPQAPPAQRALQLHDLSDFLTDDKLMVAEASYTDFAAAADEMATTRRDPL